jgi:transposase-like protein
MVRVRYRLSYADVVEWLAERGIMVDRSTVYRWVQRFLPIFMVAARSHRVPVGGKWRVDETYCRLNGRWAYCYRAIDQHGQVVDVYFSEQRNAAADSVVVEAGNHRIRRTGQGYPMRSQVRGSRRETKRVCCTCVKGIIARLITVTVQAIGERREVGMNGPFYELR